MRFLSLFSGIEAASVAWHPLGWQCAGVSEIEPFPCQLLACRYPSVPNLGDVTKITEDQIKALGRIDVVVFGSPCQDLSVAGKRKGLLNADGTITRSGLFFAAFNIFQWARKHGGARFALWENVAGAYSSNAGQDFAAVVSYMAGLDDVAVPAYGWGKEGCALGDNGLLEWACLDAQWFGVAQRRRRVFAVLDTGDWSSRPPILLERNSLRGDSPPSRKAGSGFASDVAPSLSAQSNASLRLDSDAYVGAYRMAAFGEYAEDGTASTIKRRDFKDATDLVTYGFQPRIGRNGRGDMGEVASALTAHAGETGKGDAAPCVAVCFTENSRGEVRLEGGDGQRTGALSTGGGKPGQGYPAVACAVPSASPAGGASTSGALAFDSRQDPISSPHVSGALGKSLPQAQAVAYGIPGNWIGRSPENGGNSVEPMHNVAPCLTKTDRHGVSYSGFDVRRLTPVECERLQGFPDGYTDVLFNGKPVTDGHRYKALGNSMAVPVMRWIGRQIQGAAGYC